MRLAVVQRITGLLLMLFSITMLPPAAISLYFSDGGAYAFFAGFAITAASGALIWLPVRNRLEELRLRDGFLIVATFWIGLGSFDFGRDWGALFDAPADNRFILKVNYWLGI